MGGGQETHKQCHCMSAVSFCSFICDLHKYLKMVAQNITVTKLVLYKKHHNKSSAVRDRIRLFQETVTGVILIFLVSAF